MSDHYRCYGLMDVRGRFRAWRFGPDTETVHRILIDEAARGAQVLFASVQSFAPPGGADGLTRWRAVRDQYSGEGALPHWAPLYFDLDAEGDPEQALLWARWLVEFLVEQLELPVPAVRVWFSGAKGVHVMADPVALGIEPDPMLTADLKGVALELVAHLQSLGAPEMATDAAVYSVPRLLRMPDQLHPKTGLYKVELSHRELHRCSAEQIQALARTPRGSLWAPDELPDGSVPLAAQWWTASLERARQPRQFRIRTAEVAGLKVRPDGYVVDELVDDAMPSCIARLLRATVSPGSRNRVELQTACWAKAAKLPYGKALAMLTTWTTGNRPELSAENARAKAESIMRSVYGSASYGFSCIAARSVARAVGVAAECEGCRAVRPRSLRQACSLRVRHDAHWNPPERISLEDARGLTARVIDRRVAACRAPRPGDRAARRRQDPRGPSGSGQARDAGRLCGTHA